MAIDWGGPRLCHRQVGFSSFGSGDRAFDAYRPGTDVLGDV